MFFRFLVGMKAKRFASMFSRRGKARIPVFFVSAKRLGVVDLVD